MSLFAYALIIISCDAGIFKVESNYEVITNKLHYIFVIDLLFCIIATKTSSRNNIKDEKLLLLMVSGISDLIS